MPSTIDQLVNVLSGQFVRVLFQYVRAKILAIFPYATGNIDGVDPEIRCFSAGGVAEVLDGGEVREQHAVRWIFNDKGYFLIQCLPNVPRSEGFSIGENPACFSLALAAEQGFDLFDSLAVLVENA